MGPTGATFMLSDVRVKKDIAPLSEIKGFCMALNPVKYRYQNNADQSVHYGLIAQDVEASMEDTGIDPDFAGLVKTPTEADDVLYHLNYTEFIAILIKMVQDQQREIDRLKLSQRPKHFLS
jgi:hypothetical protein